MNSLTVGDEFLQGAHVVVFHHLSGRFFVLFHRRGRGTTRGTRGSAFVGSTAFDVQTRTTTVKVAGNRGTEAQRDRGTEGQRTSRYSMLDSC